jgi:hypothetical protein
MITNFHLVHSALLFSSFPYAIFQGGNYQPADWDWWWTGKDGLVHLWSCELREVQAL